MAKYLDKINKYKFKVLSPTRLKFPLNLYKAKLYYSHQGEDGITQEIFKRLKIEEGCYVEFGATDGISASNTFGLLLKSWRGVYIEGDTNYFKILMENMRQDTFKGIKNASGDSIPFSPEVFRILEENIVKKKRVECIETFLSLEPGATLEDALSQTNLPRDIDLMSIDIDGNDYWIWQSLNNYQPKVVVVEYNYSFHPHESKTIPYNSQHQTDGSINFGASAMALYQLAKQKGYTLVANTYSNLFFIRNEYIQGRFKALDIKHVKKTGMRPLSQKAFQNIDY
ncbi:MAG: hypothetical protein Q7T03_08460 [Deltaproteobacteria bacterium]|nr:hypothetical protein [Deltaproteobacteria bacterium]